MAMQERQADAGSSIGVVVVTHRARRASRALPAAPVPLAAAAPRAGRQLLVRRRHGRAGPVARCRDADRGPAGVQPRPDPRAGPPPSRHWDRGHAHARRLPPAGRFHRAAHRAACARARPPSPTAGRWRARMPASSSGSAASSTTPRPATSAARQTGPSYGSYLRFCSNACCRLVERGPRPDRRLQADPGVGGDDRGRRAAGAGRADRLRRRGGGRAQPTRTMSADAFRRQFDIGYSRRIYDWLLLAGEGDEPRGRRFAAAVLRTCPARGAGRAARHRRPAGRQPGSAIVLGLAGHRLPRGLARRLSGQDYFWTSDVADRRRRRSGAGVRPGDASGVSHQQPVPAARGHRAACARGRPAAAGGAATQVTVLARGGAFAPWAESMRGWPAGPPLPVLPRAALPSCAGSHRARRLAARWGRRRRAAARSPAAAAAAADRPAGGRDVSQPDAAPTPVRSPSRGCARC